MKNSPSFKFTIACILSLALFQNCDEPLTELGKLPPATQSGESTFGCLVNGKAWVTEISTDADAYYQDGRLFISTFLTKGNVDQGITISLKDYNLTEKEYILMEYPEIFGRLRNHVDNCEYLTSSIHIGSLIVTHLDQINYIISGTFEFELYS